MALQTVDNFAPDSDRDGNREAESRVAYQRFAGSVIPETQEFKTALENPLAVTNLFPNDGKAVGVTTGQHAEHLQKIAAQLTKGGAPLSSTLALRDEVDKMAKGANAETEKEAEKPEKSNKTQTQKQAQSQTQETKNVEFYELSMTTLFEEKSNPLKNMRQLRVGEELAMGEATDDRSQTKTGTRQPENNVFINMLPAAAKTDPQQSASRNPVNQVVAALTGNTAKGQPETETQQQKFNGQKKLSASMVASFLSQDLRA